MLYIFYNVVNKRRVLDTPVLYAVTNNKKLAKKFKETRNMNYFRCIKRDIDDEDALKFMDQHSGNILSDSGYITSDPENPTRTTIVNVVSTRREEMFAVLLSDDKVFAELAKYTTSKVCILTEEYLKLLKYFNYFEVFHYKQSNDRSEDIDVDKSLKLSDWGIMIDQYAMLMMQYGYTFV